MVPSLWDNMQIPLDTKKGEARGGGGDLLRSANVRVGLSGSRKPCALQGSISPGLSVGAPSLGLLSLWLTFLLGIRLALVRALTGRVT
jgi:hypothetical protein